MITMADLRGILEDAKRNPADVGAILIGDEAKRKQWIADRTRSVQVSPHACAVFVSYVHISEIPSISKVVFTTYVVVKAIRDNVPLRVDEWGRELQSELVDLVLKLFDEVAGSRNVYITANGIKASAILRDDKQWP